MNTAKINASSPPLPYTVKTNPIDYLDAANRAYHQGLPQLAAFYIYLMGRTGTGLHQRPRQSVL